MANCWINKQASLCRCLTAGHRINQKLFMQNFNRLSVLTALAILSAVPVPATAQQAEACDTLAASPEDMQRPASLPGVKTAAINMVEALPACVNALADAPDNPRLQFELARLLNISKTEPAQMLKLYVASAKQNYAISMVNLGVAAENGTDIKQNYETAAKWYAKAAAEPLSNRVGMYNLALLYKAGLGVARDTKRYGTLACKSAKAGYTLAFNDCGFAYDQGWGFDKNPTEANAWYQKGVDAGDPAAMANLGTSYEAGSGVAKDLNKAIALYQKSAALGNAQGMFNLGNALLVGRGIKQDVKAAMAWLEKTADGLTTIGMAYDTGKFVDHDAQAAATNLLKALHQQSLDAQNILIEKAGEDLAADTLAAIQAQLQKQGKNFQTIETKFSAEILKILSAY
jgi:uncharacterized protein